ncbi:MAG: glycosyltransferase family 2 protein [Chloroflexota bacterium]
MSEKVQQKIIVAMPAYNEGKYIGSIVLQAKKQASLVVVVDDGSADRTAMIAELAGARVVRHGENRGYGSAIQSIFAAAREEDPDVLVILDADSQHNPEEIPRLVDAVNAGADVVIGSREKHQEAIPRYRRVGQKVLTTMTTIASREKLKDTESGFRAYSRKAVKELELRENGMAVSSEIVTAAARKGLIITEVPISVSYSPDSSTLNPVMHGLSVFSRIGYMISERRPLLVFGGIGTVCIIFGIIIGFLVIQTLRAEQVMQVGSALVSMLLITTGLLSISTGLILSVLVRRLGNAPVPRGRSRQAPG